MNSPQLSDSEATELLQSILIAGPIELQRIGEGGQHFAWLVNEAIILRIPVDQSNTAHIDWEQKLTALISTKAPATESLLPACLLMGTWHGWRYGIYRRIPGTSIEATPGIVNESTERGLCHFLQALSSVSVESAAQVVATEEVDFDQIGANAAKALARLQSRNQVGGFNNNMAKLMAYTHSDVQDTIGKVVAHADLKGEHIFVDADGKLTGVIDWSDAVVTHPAVDVAGLAISVGSKRAARIGSMAGYSDAVVAAGVTLARWNTIINLDARLNGGDDSPEWLLRRQLRRAFGSSTGIELEIDIYTLS